MGGKVDVLAIYDRRIAEAQGRLRDGRELFPSKSPEIPRRERKLQALILERAAVAELIERAQKVAALDYLFMSDTQWDHVQALSATLAKIGPTE